MMLKAEAQGVGKDLGRGGPATGGTDNGDGGTGAPNGCKAGRRNTPARVVQ